MYRNELNYSDKQLIEFLFKGYGIIAIKLDFIDIGSFYAFIVTTENNRKLLCGGRRTSCAPSLIC